MTVVQGQYDGQSGRWTATQAFQYALENSGQYNATHSQHFFFAQGQQVGSYGQLADGSGAFRANFDVNYTPVSDSYPDSAPSEVVAQKGDTLRILAARVFGDGNLWYLIAQENGLTDPDAQIDPGTVVRIPNEVVSLSNTASSFKPFDAQAAIGDTSPTQPMPPQPKPKKKGCGILGQILVIIVVIVVTIYTAGALSGAAGAAGSAAGGGAAAGGAATAGSSFAATMSAGMTAIGGGISTATVAAAAVGSAAGQLAGIAMGVQDKFSWKGVAMAAVGAGVSGGLGSWGAFGDAMGKIAQVNPYLAVGVQSAAGNALTQGANVALGLQKSFDWKSVATSAVAAPLAQAVSDKVGAWATPGGKDAFDRAVKANVYTTGRFAADTAGTITTTAVRSAFGGKFDVSQVVSDVFGNALGNAIASKIAVNGRATDLLTRAGLSADRTDHRFSSDFTRALVGAGLEDDEVLLFLNEPGIRAGMLDRDVTVSGGISDRTAANRAHNFIEARQEAIAAREAARVNPPAPFSNGELPTYIEEITVTARYTGEGPSGSTITEKVFTGGVQLVDGFTTLAEKYETLARIGYGATKALITGGPVKTVVSKIAQTAFDGAVTRARSALANLAQTKTAEFVTDLDINTTLVIRGESVAIGADMFGGAAGQVAGGVVDTLLDGGLRQIVARGGNIRNIARPTPRTSELNVETELGAGNRPQISYKDREEVKYGTPGSVRPDNTIGNRTVEVKNYAVESADGRRRLATNIAEQAQLRIKHLPPGMRQTVVVDVTGQNLSLRDQQSLVNDIVRRSNGILQPADITIRRD